MVSTSSFISLSDAAERMGIHEATVRVVLCKRGIKPTKEAGQDCIPVAVFEELDADYVEKHKTKERSAEELTSLETADVLFPDKAAELKKLHKANSPDYRKALEKHLSRVDYLVAIGKLTRLATKQNGIYRKQITYVMKGKLVKAVFSMNTFSKKQVYELKLNGVYAQVTELPPNWKTFKQVACERGVKLNKAGQVDGVFAQTLAEIIDEQEKAGTPIAQECVFEDAKGRTGRVQLKVETLRLYPILDVRLSKSEALKKRRLEDGKQRFLKALEVIDPLDVGATYRQIALQGKFEVKRARELADVLAKDGTITKVPVSVSCGVKGNVKRSWPGAKLNKQDAETKCEPKPANRGRQTGWRKGTALERDERMKKAFQEGNTAPQLAEDFDVDPSYARKKVREWKAGK
jgi:hypothetical protein